MCRVLCVPFSETFECEWETLCVAFASTSLHSVSNQHIAHTWSLSLSFLSSGNEVQTIKPNWISQLQMNSGTRETENKQQKLEQVSKFSNICWPIKFSRMNAMMRNGKITGKWWLHRILRVCVCLCVRVADDRNCVDAREGHEYKLKRIGWRSVWWKMINDTLNKRRRVSVFVCAIVCRSMITHIRLDSMFVVFIL